MQTWRIAPQRVVELLADGSAAGDVSRGGGDDDGDPVATATTVRVHARVGAHPEASNRGGVKCLLCNAFKLRKDHLKMHYVKHHGFNPKVTEDAAVAADAQAGLPIYLKSAMCILFGFFLI